ncbi:MAG TPA: hypothetical protein ENI52_04305 [Thermoplasmata archaeon]|nr:hypothetical protein [Thermoplasmata archaeon]
MKWDNDDYSDWRVVEHGGWCDKENIRLKFPERAGVYVFADIDLQVKYIGSAGAGRLREEAISAIRRGKGRGASKANWLATNSEENARSLEYELINKYNPSNNY